MDISRFAEGYASPARHTVTESYKEEPEVTQLMEGPRKWTSFFDAQLMGYLKDEPAESPEDIFRHIVVDYSRNWVEPHLYNSIASIHECVPNSEDAGHAANELHFHAINRELLPMWLRLLLPEHTKPFTVNDLYAMQVHLSVLAVEIARAKATSTNPRIIRTLDGQLTEIDAPITLLEQMKHRIKNGEPELLLIPAPQQFESGHRNRRRSADFIMLDTDSREARGLQVKTHITTLFENPRNLKDINPAETSIPVKRYDEDYITLIDGNIDLGNSGLSPSRRGIISAPGLTSISFLHNNVSIKQIQRNPLLRHDIQPIMLAKLRAKELAGNTKPYFKFSTTHIIDRVLHDMYKDSHEKEPSQ